MKSGALLVALAACGRVAFAPLPDGAHADTPVDSAIGSAAEVQAWYAATRR